jgi:serine protease Do
VIRSLALVIAVALVGGGQPVAMSAERQPAASVAPESFASAVRVARAAVVSLTLPGRAAAHGLLVDDWPDEEDLADGPAGADDGDFTLGSAVIVESSGIAVTTARLGRRALALKAVTSDGRRLSAMVVGRDEVTDIAVLSLCCDARPLPAIALGDSDRLRAGDWLVAIGAPFGLAASATASVVSAITGEDPEGPEPLVHLGPSVTAGYGGGPVVDATGTMMGLVVGHEAGVGTALPANTVRTIISALLEDGRVRRGSLGVKGQTLSAELAGALRAPDGRGVVIVDVRPDGAAARAGLRPGDIVYEVEGRRVESPARLGRTIARLQPGAKASLRLWQRGREITRQITIGEEPDEESFGSVRWRTQALLGADVATITSDMGVVVAEVDVDGPGARAGIRRGDILREVNGRSIRSLADFDTALGGLTVDSPVVILLQRGATSLYVTFAP